MPNKSIIRAKNAGVFYGEVVAREDAQNGVNVTIRNCRRIWYWEGAASLSQLAMEGVKFPENCKFSVTVPEMEVMDVIEIIPCTEDAIRIIENVPVWRI
jgi:hypothetical protein